MHTVAPVVSKYLPARQAEQTVAPEVPVKDPAAQRVQTVTAADER